MTTYVAIVVALAVALICTVQHVEAQQERNEVDEAIIAAFERLRADMPAGNPDLGIPPLDPLYIEHYALNISIELFTLDLIIDETTITKLSSFVVNSISNDLENLKASFNVTLPEIDLQGQYIASGELQDFMDITGNGSFTLELDNLNTWGTVTLGSESANGDGPVVIEKLEVDFTLGAMTTGFENFMGGGEQGEAMNELISSSAPDLISQLQPGINDYISNLVIGLANPILSHYTINQIYELLGVNSK